MMRPFANRGGQAWALDKQAVNKDGKRISMGYRNHFGTSLRAKRVPVYWFLTQDAKCAHIQY